MSSWTNWMMTMMSNELKKKVDAAIRLLESCYEAAGEPLEIAYSTGKDSDVILMLAKMSRIGYRAIYRCTTIDPPGSIQHAIENHVEVRRPEKDFFTLMRENGYPGQFYRFCCKYLKEYKIMDHCVMGVRRSESQRRAARYTEPTECKFYGSKKNHVEAIYPILDWTDGDELTFIKFYGIKLNPAYYREDGSIDITRRVGCMCCPLKYHKKRIVDFEAHPNMVKAWLRNGFEFYNTHPDVKARKLFPTIYEKFVCDVFFEKLKDFQKAKDNGLFGDVDYKKFLEDHFKIALPDYKYDTDEEA